MDWASRTTFGPALSEIQTPFAIFGMTVLTATLPWPVTLAKDSSSETYCLLFWQQNLEKHRSRYIVLPQESLNHLNIKSPQSPSPHLSLPSSGPPLSTLNGRPKESPRDSRHGTSKRWHGWRYLYDTKQLTNQDCCLHSLLHQVWQKLSQFSQQCCGNIACRAGLNFKHAEAMSERFALCLEPPHIFCRC